MKKIFSIDPGTTESGWVVYDPHAHAVTHKGVTNNHELLGFIDTMPPHLEDCDMAIEMIASQGMAVGAEVFETCVWVGMFMHAWQGGYSSVHRITRNQAKTYICGSAAAKDPNVRKAIVDLFPSTGGGKEPQVGTSKQPGPLFGMNTHMWPALAVALTAWNRMQRAEPKVMRRRAKL